MAEVDPQVIRQIKIKTGVVKRLAKEKTSYEKEFETKKVQVEKMKADGKDEYDIRKQEEVLQESNMMIPDCERRLRAAWDDLTQLSETEKDRVKGTEEYKAAVAMLEETRAAAKR